jgi:hypothetical protein
VQRELASSNGLGNPGESHQIPEREFDDLMLGASLPLGG